MKWNLSTQCEQNFEKFEDNRNWLVNTEIKVPSQNSGKVNGLIYKVKWTIQ